MEIIFAPIRFCNSPLSCMNAASTPYPAGRAGPAGGAGGGAAWSGRKPSGHPPMPVMDGEADMPVMDGDGLMAGEVPPPADEPGMSICIGPPRLRS